MPVTESPDDSVCILRLSALGDVCHVLPVINAIRRHKPGSRLTWIVGKFEHGLVKGLPDVEFIPFDKKAGWRAYAKLHHEIGRRRFNTLLHMQVSARANLASTRISADDRIGWDRSRSRDFHHLFVNRHVATVPCQHQVDGFLEFARSMNLDPGIPEWNLPVSKEATTWAADQVDSGAPVVVISPCSSHPLRNWQPSYYAQLADFFVGDLGARVVLSGGPSVLEKKMAGDIESLMRLDCLNLVGKDTIEQLKGLLQSADLLVSPDSGPAHIASALGTPVLGLYAATWSRRSGPYNSLELCVDRFREAARKFRRKEPEALRWGTRIEEPGVMDLIQPREVMDQISAWWSTRLNGGSDENQAH